MEEEEKDNRKKLKAKREHAQQWESTRESRVGTWRDFVTKKAPNKVRLGAAADSQHTTHLPACPGRQSSPRAFAVAG